MKEPNYQEFRTLLRSAIGDRTQAEFASQADLSPEHVSRMLNNPVIHRPTRATLEKIAAIADGGVTYRMLLASLDRDPDSAAQSPVAVKRAQEDFETENLHGSLHDRETFERIARECFAALAAFIKKKSAPGLALPVPNLAVLMEGVLEEFRKTPGHASFRIGYSIGKILGYYGHHFKDGAAQCATVTLSVADCLYTAQSEVILYFTPIGNRLIIQGMDMSAKAVYDIWGVDPYAMDRLMETCTQEEALDRAFMEPFTFIVRDQKKNGQKRTVRSEKEFLDSIFGSGYRFPQVRYGTGFYLEHIPESFVDFAKEHKDAVLENCDNGDDATHLTTLLEDASLTPEKLAEELDRMEYADGYSDHAGWRAMVAAVMYTETSFPFIWLRKEEPENEKERADPAFRQMEKQSAHAVLLMDSIQKERGIAENTLFSILSRYARELGVPLFGNLFHHGVQVINASPKTYRTPSKEDRAFVRNENDPSEESKKTPEEFLSWPDHRPEETGIYRTVLKDGRVLECLYLEKRHDWIRFHVCWNHMVEAFDPKPVKK